MLTIRAKIRRKPFLYQYTVDVIITMGSFVCEFPIWVQSADMKFRGIVYVENENCIFNVWILYNCLLDS